MAQIIGTAPNQVPLNGMLGEMAFQDPAAISVKLASVTSTATSTSTITGALIVSGGVGIGGSLYANAVYDNGSRVVTAASLGNYGVSTITAGTDTAVNTTTGAVTVWNTGTLQSVTNRGAITTNQVTLNNGLILGSTSQVPISMNGSYSQSQPGFIAATGILVGNTTTTLIYALNYQHNLAPISLSTITSYYGQLFLPTLTNTATYTAMYGNFSRIDMSAGATSGSVNTWYGYYSAAPTRNAAADVRFTNHISFYAQDPGFAVTATNIYGVQTAIGVGTGKYNIYSSGLADSFFNGNVGIGTNAPTSKLDVSGTVNISGITTVTNTTAATSTITGALQVIGGVGIGGSLYAGNIYSNGTLVTGGGSSTGTTSTFLISNTTTSTSTTTGALVVTGGVGIGGSLYVGGEIVAQRLTIQLTTITTTLVTTDDIISTNNTTAATTTNSGALQVVGGIGVGGSVYSGGSIYATTEIAIAGSNFVSFGGQNSSTRIKRDGGLNGLDLQTSNLSRLFIADTDGAVTIRSTATSTSTTTGALIVAGGVGISGNLWVGGTINGSVSGGAGSSDQVKTIRTGTNAAYYPTFVDANNTTATAETLYTTSSFTINPSTGNVGVGTIAPTSKLHVAGSLRVTGLTAIADTTTSTSTVTGALVVSGGLGVGGQVNINNTLTVGGTNSILPNTIAHFQANVNNYAQINNQNLSSGNAASTDVILTTDTGNDTTGFLDLGINNSGFSQAGSFDVVGANAGYLYVAGADLALGVSGANTLKLFTGGVLTGNTRMSVNSTGVVNISTTATSTGTATGALVVTGGVGIGGSLYAGNIYSNGVLVGAIGTSTTSTFLISNTTSATSTTTGALVVAGGVGVGGNIYVGAKVGFVNASNVSVAYQYYNAATNSIDTVFE
jgi:hypothetical protein